MKIFPAKALILLMMVSRPLWAQPADLVLRGGAIYTMDAARSWAAALAVDEGKIVYVGTETGVDKWIGEGTEVLELEGRMVLPGFHDSHVHPVSGGVELNQCDLNPATSVAEIEQKLTRYAAENPELEWVVGGEWQMPLFPDGQPTAAQLDRLIPDRPAFISSSDAHTVWVNSKALEAAGIGADTPDPEGGKIDRDVKGKPTGLLREEAIGLISKLLPEVSEQEYREGLLTGLAEANRYGITSLIEANATDPMVKAYRQLESEGLLTARVVAALYTNPKAGAAQVPGLVQRRKAAEGKLFRATSVKLFADGVIEAHTAALLEPYLDAAHRGISIWRKEDFEETVSALQKENFQIHVHAIGDRAIRETLDALDKAKTDNGFRDLRHQIAHLQLLSPGDIQRFRALGIVANFQPLWAYHDSFIEKLTIPVLGEERSNWLYPIKSFHDHGVAVVAGSDWSVTSINPLPAIQVGVTRTDPDEPNARPLLPEQAMTLPAMLALYTINGAYGMHQEEQTGSLEVGKAADLVILERNLFEVPVKDIGKVKVLRTILAGRTVYRSEGQEVR
ncbi:MAG: amidohydrolase [Candidatus Eremiobacteraeota bacterium]|nr:amidohydrolase [Candidatus Eremiobacteraeota bacterium]